MAFAELMPSAMADRFQYRLFGLNIQSEMELPELVEAGAGEEPDVQIKLGEVPAVADTTRDYWIDEQGASLFIHGVARYLVSGGSVILVQPEATAPMRNVRLFLLGSVMGILLHQRGLLPLHANAVEIEGRAVAFMGRSGAGKSTLAAWFHDHGYRILADDVCVVHFDDGGRAMVSPGISRLRLWEDALTATGREEAELERSYAGDEDYMKFDVPIATNPGGAPVPLGAIYCLERGNALVITPLTGAGAVDAIFANTYRGRFVRDVGNSRTHWEACLRLVRAVPIFRLERPWGHDRLKDSIEQVLAHARSSIVPTPG